MASLQKELLNRKNKEKAKFLSGFFKTGKGEYGEGDVFLGINVPLQRQLAKSHKDLNQSGIQKLLESKFHEFRLTGLLILVEKYKNGGEKEKVKVTDFYLKNIRFINNWDLVDLSAPNILGSYFLNKDREILIKLAKSDNLWARRISIVATFAFIRNGEYADTLRISAILLSDKHDLIHKAVGWMLREVGKKDQKVLLSFLDEHVRVMPRTALRYAIERLSEKQKKRYMKKA